MTLPCTTDAVQQQATFKGQEGEIARVNHPGSIVNTLHCAQGCTFIDAGYSKLKYLLFGLTYVIVTPIGIAIGLGVGNTYHDGSKAALGTQAHSLPVLIVSRVHCATLIECTL